MKSENFILFFDLHWFHLWQPIQIYKYGLTPGVILSPYNIKKHTDAYFIGFFFDYCNRLETQTTVDCYSQYVLVSAVLLRVLEIGNWKRTVSQSDQVKLDVPICLSKCEDNFCCSQYQKNDQRFLVTALSSIWLIQIALYFRKSASLSINMGCLYKLEPVLKSGNHSWCFAVQSSLWMYITVIVKNISTALY